MITHVNELAEQVGHELGVTDWVLVDQQRIDRFADATGDHQWIHVDRERAAAGPFGTTIAHGYLTLSMLPIFLEPILAFEGIAMQLNYGLESVRFPHPVPVDSRIRARISVDAVDETDRGIRVVLGCIIEIADVDKPACVARPVALLIREG